MSTKSVFLTKNFTKCLRLFSTRYLNFTRTKPYRFRKLSSESTKPKLWVHKFNCYSTQEVNSAKSHSSFRHQYHEDVENAVNQQILSELNAGMLYLSMYCHYGRTDIVLPGCQFYFKHMYKEEFEHAMYFINYQLKRGAKVRLYPTTVPEDVNWTDVTVALGVALELEKSVKEKLECLAAIAECHGDIELTDTINTKFISEQNESLHELGRLLTNAKRLVDSGSVGRYLFDQYLFDYVKSKHSNDPSYYL